MLGRALSVAEGPFLWLTVRLPRRLVKRSFDLQSHRDCDPPLAFGAKNAQS